MQYKFLNKFGRKSVAPEDADLNDINVIPYFFSKYTLGSTREHTHDFWEITFMIKGRLEHKINERNYELNERDIILIKPQDNHQVHYLKKGDIAEFYNFEIRESFVKTFLESVDKSLYNEILTSENIHEKCNELIFQQIRSFLNYVYTMRELDYKKKQKYLQTVVSKLLCEMIFKKLEMKRGDFLVEEILDYMRSPDNMNSNLEKLALNFGYCSEHILRVFKKNGLETPSKEWKKIKMNYASNLLTETNYSVMDISQMIGISNVNYFSKIFKEFFEISPSQYRKKYYIGVEE